MKQGPIYIQCSKALDEAHKACFKNNDSVLGMSHGPFSGVNFVLGKIFLMENFILRSKPESLLLSDEEFLEKRLKSLG